MRLPTKPLTPDRGPAYHALVRGIAIVVVACGLCGGRARAWAEDPPSSSGSWFLAGSIGFHHSSLDKGGLSGTGPRLAVAVRYPLRPWISLVATGAVSYHQDDAVDAAAESSYSVEVADFWIGGRVRFYPISALPQVWIGVGGSLIGEHQHNTLNMRSAWSRAMTPELVAGGHLMRFREVAIQLEATLGRYGRSSTEHVTFGSLSVGVEY
jgi:hypothetical protein